jgi:hypothetical protein
MTLEELEREVDRLWPGSISAQVWGVDSVQGWSCTPNSDEALVGGSVATCRPDPPVEEGQEPVVTVLVLDGAGQVAVAEAGVQNPELSADSIYLDVESGLNCTQFTKTDPGPASIDDPLRYFATVLYWFLEGRPAPLMDIDENGIPCETKFTPEVVADLWNGGWFPTALPTPAGQPVDAPVQAGDVLSVFGVAHDDTLNVRAQPGADQPVVTELSPVSQVVATGRAWAVADSVWYEVEAGGGWVNSDYVAFAGTPREEPSWLWSEWGFEAAETLTELRQLVADEVKVPSSRTVVPVAPTEDEIIYDFVASRDDGLAGERVRIISEQDDQGRYVIVRIETTMFLSERRR